MKPQTLMFACGLVLALAAARSAADDRAAKDTTVRAEARRLVEIIATVGPQAKASQAARKASDQLATLGVDALPTLFEGMDTPNIVAANWCRIAAERILRVEFSRREPRLPVEFLHSYVADPKRQGRPRRLALALLDRLKPGTDKRLKAGLLDDPEFRGDAVQLALEAGQTALKARDTATAKRHFRAAFSHSRESGVILQAAAKLKQLGESADARRQMGFVTRWYLLGPFDAPETSGFDRSFPPEQEVALKKRYVGKKGEIGWKLFETTDSLGQLNLIQAIAPVKEAVGFAYTEVESPRDQQAQVRCGADDNLSVWVNGKKVFARRQWLNGTRLDRFTAPVQLRKGRNRVLVKICQGPQHKNPAVPNNWSVQLRFCDSTGASVGLKNLLPPPKSP